LIFYIILLVNNRRKHNELCLGLYEGWSKSFQPDTQKPRQMEKAARDI